MLTNNSNLILKTYNVKYKLKENRKNFIQVNDKNYKQNLEFVWWQKRDKVKLSLRLGQFVQLKN